MNWAGKIIGGTLGMLALGPIGAALGAFIGHQFDSGQISIATFTGGPDPRLVNQLFFPTAFRVMGHIAKADGRVTEQEIASARAVMHAMHLQPEQIQAAIGYFNEGKQPSFDLDAALAQLRASIARTPDLALFFVEIQLQASIAGNGLSEVPRARLQRVALLLGLSAGDFARLEACSGFARERRWVRAGALGAQGVPVAAGGHGHGRRGCAQRAYRAGLQPARGIGADERRGCREGLPAADEPPSSGQAAAPTACRSRCSSAPRSARSRSRRPTN
jgi:DnaJ like chaperone protein